MSEQNNYDLDNIWQRPASPPILDRERVHVWRARLDLSTAEIASLATILSSDEIARANRFRFPQHKRRFIVARGVLRQLLGYYLHTEPKKIEFSYSDRGKPLLREPSPVSPLQFNLSHSQEYALYGFTYNRPIGVDLEYLREMPDLIKIARRFFSTRESELLSRTNNESRAKLFFQLWTAKEAYLKAIGTGLSGSLASVEIAIDRVPSPPLLAVRGDRSIAAEWSLYFCVPATGYTAAVAVKSRSQQQIDFWHWHQDRLCK